MEVIYTTITTVIIPIMFVMIPAIIGLHYGGMLGLILGLNVGAILTVEYLSYPDYILLAVVIADIAIYFSGGVEIE